VAVASGLSKTCRDARTDAGTALMAIYAGSAVLSSVLTFVNANYRQTNLHNKLKLCISIWSYQFEN